MAMVRWPWFSPAALGALLCAHPGGSSPYLTILRPSLVNLYRSVGEDVVDREPAARVERPPNLAEDLLLVGLQVDDAVRDTPVDRGVLERQILDEALVRQFLFS